MGGWLEQKISPLFKVLKGINHTRANDASVIFQRITLLLVSQATSKIITIKCLLNLWSTWQKCTSIHCFLISIFDPVLFDKCCLTIIGASYN